MSSTGKEEHVWVSTTPPNVPRSSMINLVNLLLRETVHRITVLERARGPDPELYVITRVEKSGPRETITPATTSSTITVRDPQRNKRSSKRG